MSSFFTEEPPQPLDTPIYKPDQELYPGQSYNSYTEMKANCPLLEVKAAILEKKGEAYTPYKCKYKKEE